MSLRVESLANNSNPHIREKYWSKWRSAGAVVDKESKHGATPIKLALAVKGTYGTDRMACGIFYKKSRRA